MFKKLFLFCSVIIFTVGLFSEYSDDFPIGAYSRTPYFNAHFDQSSPIGIIAPLLQEANFNVVGGTFLEKFTSSHFNILDSYGIDVWDNPGIIDTLTKFCHYTYEVEYYDYGPADAIPEGVVPSYWPDEVWFYEINQDDSTLAPAPGQISQQCIKCDGDEGYAVDYMKNLARNRILSGQFNIECDSINVFHLKYNMKIEEETFEYGENVCSVGLKVYCYWDSVHGDIFAYIPLISEEPADYADTLLTKINFWNVDQYFGYYEFKYYVTKQTVKASIIAKMDSTLGGFTSWEDVLGYGKTVYNGKLSGIIPIIYYYGNGELYIDNITIEDDAFLDLAAGVYDSDISSLAAYDNKVAVLGNDEPTPPQYLSYNEVQNRLDNETNLWNAVNLKYWKDAINNGYPLYNNNKLFSHLAEPNQLMTDIYPSKIEYGAFDWTSDPEIYNNNNSYQGNEEINKWHHIQTRINLMTEIYASSKKESIERGLPFYPIIQSFGHKEKIYTGDFIWKNYLLPPSQTLKAFSYLPLCYGADGIFYYHFENSNGPEHPHEEEDGEYRGHRDDASEDMWGRDDIGKIYSVGIVNYFYEPEGFIKYPQFYAVQEANEEIAYIGPLIKELDLTWLGADLAGNIANTTFCPSELNCITVYDSLDNYSAYNEGYNGYVEVGIYEDQYYDNYFMLVNRRGNFPYNAFVGVGNSLITDDIPDSTDFAFAAADSQDVTFNFDGLSEYVECAFTDMFTEEIIISQVSGGEVDITLTIGPGEGCLIQMKKHHIPSMIDSIFVVPENKDCIIDYSITVGEEGTLILSDGVTLHFRENGSIKVYGGIEIGDNVEFTAPEGESGDGLHLYNHSAGVTMNNVTFERCRLYSEREITINGSSFINTPFLQDRQSVWLTDVDFDNSPITAELYGMIQLETVSIVNCHIYNSPTDAGIEITGYPNIDISDNVIENCNSGIKIWESGSGIINSISNNIIRNNTQNYGISIYHSYVDILDHNRIENNRNGLFISRESNFNLIGSETYPLQIIRDNNEHEVRFTYDSRPGQFYHNKIYDDNHEYSYVKCVRIPPIHEPIDVSNNNWGSTFNPETDLSPTGLFRYLPIWDPGVPRDPIYGSEGEMYILAKQQEEAEDYSEAEQTYKQLISIYPASEYAKIAAKELLALKVKYDQDFTGLKLYYETEPNMQYDEEMTKLSEFLITCCDIKLEEFQPAITWFEEIIQNPPSLADSVFAVIDAGYTYLLMENSGRSQYAGKITDLKPKSRIEYEEKRDNLVNMLFGDTEPDNEIPSIIKLALFPNYPNPFNPTTTIQFSIPKESKVEITMYNIKGQKVKTLTKDVFEKGFHKLIWNGKDSSGKEVGSGVYFYKLKVNGKDKFVKKCLLLK